MTQTQSAYDLQIVQSKELHNLLVRYVKEVLVKDVDFGTIPGSRKPTLYKAGAEKLMRLFKLRLSTELVESQSFSDFEKGFFAYTVRAILTRKIDQNDGYIQIASGHGHANTKEPKYMKQTAYGVANTVLKMAEKRAMVAAVLLAVGASEFFTQDLEELEIN